MTLIDNNNIRADTQGALCVNSFQDSRPRVLNEFRRDSLISDCESCLNSHRLFFLRFPLQRLIHHGFVLLVVAQNFRVSIEPSRCSNCSNRNNDVTSENDECARRAILIDVTTMQTWFLIYFPNDWSSSKCSKPASSAVAALILEIPHMLNR